MPSHQSRPLDVSFRRRLPVPVTIPRGHRLPVALRLAIPLALLLGACSPSAAPPAAATVHLTGRASAGPVCPVERVPPDPACAPRPVPNATLVVTTATGIVVSQVRTAADGSFSFNLPDGSYRLVPQAVQGLMGGGQPIEFSVRVGGPPPPPLSVTYDTGIR